tara:strand:+ start:1753 stop:1929 length:177 start_codon:yes stop_codon:yes gene_type:complete
MFSTLVIVLDNKKKHYALSNKTHNEVVDKLVNDIINVNKPLDWYILDYLVEDKLKPLI